MIAAPPTGRRIVVALALAGAMVAYGVSDSALVDNVAYLGPMVCAAVAAWMGAERAAPEDRVVPRLIATGVTLTALGDVLWTALAALGVDTDVSAADAPWFLSYVALGAALWIVLGRNRCGDRREGDSLVDVATVVAVSVVTFWFLSIESIVADDSLTPLARVVWASYPVADAVLLALVLRAMMSTRARHDLGLEFAAGTSLWLAADIAYLGSPTAPLVVLAMDYCWLVALVLLAVSARRTGSPRSDVPAPSAPARWLPQLLLAVGPLLVPSALEVVNDMRGEPDQPIALFLSTSVLIGLAFVRTARLMRSERHAHWELELARDRAMSASRAKTLFVANVSHEIRTPLTTVLATAELLEETRLDDAQRRLLERMQRSGGRLSALVEEVLDFSRIEAGEVTVNSVPVDLHALVEEIAGSFAGRGGDVVAFEWHLDARTPRMTSADPTRIFQIVANLLDNAFKFTLEGRVRLEVGPSKAAEGSVDFIVDDTGIGIATESLDTVFESFLQVDGSVTRGYGGSGLGLAICKELTQLLGGTISVRSREGVGSTFCVSLPLAAVQGRPATRAAAPYGRALDSR